MRYPASEKLEIIRTVETSHLPVRRTLDKIGIPKTTFYAWLDRYAAGGLDALDDRKPRPKRVWNRIPDEIRYKVIERALDEPELSPATSPSPSQTLRRPSSPRLASIAS
jgi:putative transposase